MIRHHAAPGPGLSVRPRCEYEDGTEIFMTFNANRVDCVVCRDLLAGPARPVPYVDPKEHPLRHSRPDYVPTHAVYVPFPIGDPDERPRGRGPAFRILCLIVAVIAVTLIVAAFITALAVPGAPRPAPTPIPTPASAARDITD